VIFGPDLQILSSSENSDESASIFSRFTGASVRKPLNSQNEGIMLPVGSEKKTNEDAMETVVKRGLQWIRFEE
jgi:hypothetical protein